MSKRIGRPPKDPASKKSAHLSIRMSAKLRGLLQAEAIRHPEEERSLSQEIELRLWQSFTADENIEKRFGGLATARLLSQIANAIAWIEIRCGGENHWLDDRFVYDHVRTMINIMLDHVRPPGRRVVPKLLRRLKAQDENIGRQEAVRALAMVKAATNEPMPNETLLDVDGRQ